MHPRRAPPEGKAGEQATDPIRHALGEVCGAALVLDADLRVVLATSAAEALLGFEVPLGIGAPKLLCGNAEKRPLAEALVAGAPVQAIIPRPRAGAESQLLRVRASPLAGPSGGRPCGSLLFLEVATGALSEGEVHFHGMWTRDQGMKQIFRVIERVAASDATVLVRGETGAGKELVATAVHARSRRKDGPFRAINCAALPVNLLESELFGHVRGAFTGALKDTPGHIELAHGGTLFLDEIGELPLELQAKLLRVLETRTVLPVGARKPIPVDVRVISATHRALRKEVEAGRFRADLMYRLRVIPIYIPSLRARPGDVMLICAKLMDEHNARGQRRIEAIAPAAQRAIETYDWPGNVRELKNVLEYAYAIGEGPVLTLADLPPEIIHPGLPTEQDPQFAGPDREPACPAPSAEARAESEEAARIRRALERSAGSRERAAQILGVSRVTLWRRMKALGLVGEDGER